MKKSPKKTPHKRPSWDEYFMKIAEMVGTRATCDRGRSGAVVTRDKRMLTTGYVGAPAGVKDCDEAGHEMHTVIHADGSRTEHCIRGTHAEQNALVQAARTGVSLLGGTLYAHMTPCYACAKMIINAGIVRVVAGKDYQAGKRSKEIFKQSGVKFELLSREMEKYGTKDAEIF
jgi:dCMP deaminase